MCVAKRGGKTGTGKARHHGGLTKACGDKPVHLPPKPNPLSVTAA